MAAAATGSGPDGVTPPPLEASGTLRVPNEAAALSTSMRSPADRNGRLWLTCALLVLATLVAGAVVVWQLRAAAFVRAERELTNLGIVLAEQTSRSVESVDLILGKVQSHVSTLGPTSPAEFRARLAGQDTHLFLANNLLNCSQCDTIALIDANGTLLNWSRNGPVPHVDVSDRDYFRYLSGQSGDGVFISSATEGRVTGKWLMFIARRVSSRDGAFLGLAIGMIDTGYLEDFYRTISMIQGESITLLRRDGVVIAGHPDIASRRGKQLPANAPWYDRVAKGGGSYLSPGYLAPITQIITVHPVRDYPLVVDVNMSEETVLQGWYEQVTGIVIATVSVAIGFIVLFWVIAVQFGRHEDQNARLLQSAVALRESERKLKAFAEMTADWFWEQDAEFRFVRDANIPLTSLPTDVGKTRWDLADSTMNPGRWDEHKADLAAKRPFRNFRWERIQTDGKRRYMCTSGDPIFDEAGKFLGYQGTGRDVTPEVEADNNLRAAKERAETAEDLLRDAVDSMSEGFVIYSQEARLVMCNDRFLELYGAGAGRMVPGAKLEDIIHESLARGEFVDAVGREEEWFRERVDSFWNPGQPVERQLANGKWILVADSRMRSGGLAGLRIDITALKQTQAALRESEARLDRAQSIAGVGSWELEIASGRFFWSKEMYRVRGISPDEFEPDLENIAAYIHPDDFLAVQRWVTGLIAGGGQDERQTRIVRPDGEVRTVQVEGRAILDKDGVVHGLSGTMQDITERLKMEQQLLQAQKMEAIGNLTGGMAHDFNNGLGVIIGNLGLLERMVTNDEAATEVCGEAREAALRCADLIRGLLAFARRQPLHRCQTDVNVLVGETARLLSRTLGENIAVDTLLDSELWLALTDAAQLEAAVINLATNARDAMPRGGQLRISTRNVQLDDSDCVLHGDVTPGNYVLVELSDTGTGIPPDIIERIFEPFFTTKAAGTGTGLGLSMVFTFVKQSGGAIDVYSEPGIGATFRMYLPSAIRIDASAAIEAEWRPLTGGSETVLVVEDNPRLRVVAVRQLSDLGYQVLDAENAEEGLRIATTNDGIDLLFTDVMLPGGMDGIELAHRVAQLRPGVGILLTSGLAGGRAGERTAHRDQSLILGKPYDLNVLSQAVRDVLDQRPHASGSHLDSRTEAMGDQHRNIRTAIELSSVTEEIV